MYVRYTTQSYKFSPILTYQMKYYTLKLLLGLAILEKENTTGKGELLRRGKLRELK